MTHGELRQIVQRLRGLAIEHDELHLLPDLAVLDELIARTFRYRAERDRAETQRDAARHKLTLAIAERDAAREWVDRHATEAR